MPEEIGTATTAYSAGFPDDPAEYVPDLAWPQSVQVYDRMRADATVDETYRGVALPIIKAGWNLDPNGARDDIVEHLSRDLGVPILGQERPAGRRRTRGTVKLTQHLREALTALIYGHAAFEQVWEQGPDGLMHLVKLAPRPQHSITEILTDERGDLTGIKQYVPGGRGTPPRFVEIPAERLAFYSHDREGAAWQGRSMFRAAYRNWKAKDMYMRIDLQAAERHGIGVPMVEAPEGATPEQMAELSALAQAYRGGAAAGGALPHGAKLTLQGVQGTLHDTLAAIRYQDEQIARVALRTFTMLGQSQHGSRALGETLADDFILSLQAVAEELATTIQEQIIEPLGDWNWGSDEPLPVLTFTPIGADPELTVEALARLVDVGLITADEATEAYVRQRFDLPERAERSAPVEASGGDAAPFVGARSVRAAATPTAEDTVEGQLLAELEDELTPVVASALYGLIDHEALADDFAGSGIVAADFDDRDELEAVVRAWLIAWLVTRPAVREPLVEAVDRAATVGYGVGRGLTGTADEIAAAVAAMDDTAGLAEHLAETPEVVDGIIDTRTAALTTTLTDALEQDLDEAATAQAVADTVADPATAEMVAVTETQAGHTVGVLEALAVAEAATFTYVAQAGACARCAEQAGTHVVGATLPHGYPPVHPNCRCLIQRI